MTAAINLSPLAQILAERLLNCMIEGIAIGLFAWVLLHLAGRRNSSTRFAVWFSALLAIAALPLVRSSSTVTSVSGGALALTLPASWALDIFIVWIAIASLALARVGVGLWQLRKLRASCIALETANLDPVLQKTLQDVQAQRSVTLCESERIQVPTAIGFLKPLVVLPVWARQELSPVELNSILVHELAHLRRRDDWTNLAQQILKALLFFHPAVWWIESKLALEREMACDDAVLTVTANPRGYAQCLVSIVEKSFMRRGLALAQAAVNRVRQTSLRVSQILDANRSSTTSVWKPALYSVAAFSIVCLVSVSRAPELVAFQDKTPNIAVASEVIPSGTSFSATESRLLAGGAVATPVSLRAKSVPQSAKTIAHRDGRKQVSPKALVANLVAADRNPATQTKTNASVPLSNTPGASPSLPNSELPNAPDPNTSASNRSGSTSELSNIASSREDDSRPQTILVVMQSEQYNQAGLLLQVRVWQLTVFDSSRATAARIPAKKI
jgi:beta-lactamase regulating signal transducer with metallopeptidase domain